MPRPSATYLIYGSLAAIYLVYSAVFNTQFLLSRAKPQSASVLDVVRGHAASEFESAYRRGALYRDRAVELFGAVRYRLFGEGRRGVVVGNDGWLYTAEEFESAMDGGRKIDEAVEFVDQMRNRLRAKGSDLLVALIPAKADIYPEHLGRFQFPHEPSQRYATVMNELRSRSIFVPDLRQVLREAKKQHQVFLRTDTHWTPDGAIAVADAIGAARNEAESGPGQDFKLVRTKEIAVEGDLERFLGGALNDKEPVAQYEAEPSTSSETSVDLFGGSTVPVALVGTSYSANQNWGFENALKVALHEDILNVAEQGEGPFKPMQAYLAGASFRDTPPTFVIWEIPVRYMASFDIGKKDNSSEPVTAMSASR